MQALIATFAGATAIIIGGFWTYYSYQNSVKPLLSLDGFDGRILNQQDGRMRIEFEMKVTKAGSSATANTEVITSFLNVYPPPPAPRDITYTDFPDMVAADGRPFVIEKHLAIQDFVNATKFPGYIYFFVTTRWKGSSYIFAKRTFSFSSLYRLHPRMVNDGSGMRMAFDIRGVKGPIYAETLGTWKDPRSFYNQALVDILKGEDLHSLLDLDRYVQTH